MSNKIVSRLVVLLLSSLLFAGTGLASAGASDKTDFDFGARLKLLGTFDDNGNAFDLDDARISASAKRGIFAGKIQLEYSDSDLFLKDGFASAAFNKYATVTAGRFKMPTGQNIAQSSYDSITWEKNTVASDWLSPQQGNRGDGIAVAGSAVAGDGASVTYNIGVFDSGDYDAGAIYAGRGTIAFDGVPGLDIGVTVQSEEDAAGAGKDFFGVGVDARYTATLPDVGDVVLSGGWNDYDLDGAAYFPGTGLNAGDGFYVEAATTLTETATVASIPIQFQPFFKYQSFDYTGFNGKQERWDAGINLILDGVFDETKLTVNFFTDDPVVCCNNDGVLLGVKTTF